MMHAKSLKINYFHFWNLSREKHTEELREFKQAYDEWSIILKESFKTIISFIYI